MARARTSPEAPAGPDDGGLGRRVRALRLAKGYTLKQVAALAGLSPSFVSMLENGKTGIAASRLQALAEELGLSAAELLPEAGSEGLIQTVRADRRPQVPGLAGGVRAEMLVRDLHRRIQPVLLTLAPGAVHVNPTGHPGEEFILVLRGRIVLVVDAERCELGEGDAAYYPSALSHAYENVGEGEAELFTISAPPKAI